MSVKQKPEAKATIYSYRRGKEAGREWGANRAKRGQLTRLARYKKECLANGDWEAHFGRRHSIRWHYGSPLSNIAACMMSRTPLKDVDEEGFGEFDHQDFHDFWEIVLVDDVGRALRNGEFMRGFCDGALETMKQKAAAH